MHKTLLAVAVAGALAAPAVAMAQSAVTISGAFNLWYESAGATGASNQSTGAAGTLSTFDVKARDRMRDGAGSNIRFTVVEDIGGGLQAFGQVESAVFNNADTRADAVGNGAVVGGWANRNSGVGLRGSSWGEVLIGIWDIHYQETYAVDNQLIKGPSSASSLAVFNSFGTVGFATGAGSLGAVSIGARYSNVLRYQSPSWGGFNFRAAMARPTDGNVPTTAGSVTDGSKNRVWNIVPNFSSGPIYVSWSYLKDKDVVAAQATTTYANATILGSGGTANVGSAAVGGVASNLYTITSNRFHAAYTFPFGLKIGAIFDSSKLQITSSGGVGGSELKKTAWSVPISWTTGPHAVFATYGRASDLKGHVGLAGGGSADLGDILVTPQGGSQDAVGSQSGATFISLGYQFDLSKRTNVHLNFSQIKNEKLAGYDYFSNTVGMANGNFGADPKIYSIGLRHAF